MLLASKGTLCLTQNSSFKLFKAVCTCGQVPLVPKATVNIHSVLPSFTLPFFQWLEYNSTDGLDLCVAHMFGMHGLFLTSCVGRAHVPGVL